MNRSRSVTALLLLASLIALTFAASAALAAQAPVDLGDAKTFGALSATGLTNAGLDTVLAGDIGSSGAIDVGVTHPGYAAYGAGAIQLADAQASLLTAFNFATAQTPTGDITGVNLAGATKLPGVYNSTGAILIDGPVALTLDGGGDASSVFIFQAAAAGDLTVTNTSSVTYTNGAQPCHVFWKVRNGILQNTGDTFVGTILALNAITLTADITVEGRLLARNANVTFNHDTVNVPTTCASAPAAPAAVVRQLYCDPVTFQSYDLIKGQDTLPPYAKLGLVLAYVDPVTGSQSCTTLRAIAAAKVAAAAAATAKAAADAAAAAATAANVEAAKVAAAKAVEAAKLAATKAAEAEVAAAKAATAKALAAKVAAAKAAKQAKASAVRAAQATKVATAKAAAKKAKQRTHAKQALRRAGFTG